MSKHEGGLKAEHVRTMIRGIEAQRDMASFAINEIAMDRKDTARMNGAISDLDQAVDELRDILARHDALTA